jgi:preprotein translocase subunit SecG
MVKVAVAAVVVLFVVFYIVTSPDNAASMAHGAGHLVSRVANGIGNFLNKLAS